MLRRTILAASAACLVSSPGAYATSTPSSGIDLRWVLPAVRPQDDIYRHLNGKWLEDFRIPADKSSYSMFTRVNDETQQQLKVIVDGLLKGGVEDPEARKVADLYASYLDVARVDALGVSPIEGELRRIDALSDKRGIAALIARYNESVADAPFDVGIAQDSRDSTRYAVYLAQGGLGLPNRDYYLSQAPKLVATRAAYLRYVRAMFRLAGLAHPARSATEIMQLETALAKLQWSPVANRDPVKTYNKTTLAGLPRLMGGYDWSEYLRDTGLVGKVNYVIVSQPSYFTGLGRLIEATPLPVWKAYFRWRVLSAAAPYLSQTFVRRRFAFEGTVLKGTEVNRPRWQRGLSLVDVAMGEALGKLYVARYFPPRNKARMLALVHHLIEAYRADIAKLDWMSPPSRAGALAKLDKLAIKIGYPDKWRDYGALSIRRDDLYGNVVRATEFEFQRERAKLGKPIDRTEWDLSPQTVNAYYDPTMNEIVFPAAILQPPFFDVNADEAANYGAIGAVIGHEISHGFDDEGSQFDANGNLRDWMTPADHAKFAAKTRALVAQYSRYEPVPGFHVNGQLTLGENIADNSGLAIAYQAYHLALHGRPAPVIDGMTGDQRFYYGFVQMWRGKVRRAQQILWLKADPHSPPYVRGTAPLRNQAGFYRAFDVKPGDKMYLSPSQRVSIW
jgi:predicted metalloendopeptidase